MLTISAPKLKEYASAIFAAAGAAEDDAGIVGDALVDANLAGHDSHGVMRIPNYVGWMEQKLINVEAELKVVADAEAFAVVDCDWGFGQVMGREATDLAIAKAFNSGAASVAGRNCCHLGRLGDYPAMAAREGMVAVMFINTHGGGKIVAPFGGIERRLSANPIAIGIPRAEGPIVVDVSTCSIAEGKVRNMRTAGQPVPAGCIIDAAGKPSTDANDFYGPPPGALLPFGGHKGFAMGLAADILAGALSGAGCSRPGVDRIGNSFLITVIDIAQMRDRGQFDEDVHNLVEYVKSSKLAPGVDEILVPGEPESRTQERRERDGIPIHEATWAALAEVAGKYGVAVHALE
jgi:uncharacterized oxidoreductase